jgi:hypothetical protein
VRREQKFRRAEGEKLNQTLMTAKNHKKAQKLLCVFRVVCGQQTTRIWG